jgi:hypothetical protein
MNFPDGIVLLICHCLLATAGVGGSTPIACCMSRDIAAAYRIADTLNSATLPLMRTIVYSVREVYREEPVRGACAAD